LLFILLKFSSFATRECFVKLLLVQQCCVVNVAGECFYSPSIYAVSLMFCALIFSSAKKVIVITLNLKIGYYQYIRVYHSMRIERKFWNFSSHLIAFLSFIVQSELFWPSASSLTTILIPYLNHIQKYNSGSSGSSNRNLRMQQRSNNSERAFFSVKLIESFSFLS
jgi:hypothetical protein